jgi:polyphosphate kinase
MSTPRNSARKQSRASRHSVPQPQPQSNRTDPGNPCSVADPRLYINRELSLLAFQKRVLEEAEDPHNPLLERVKFLSIFGSNLEEFFMVRVAGLKRQVEGGVLECGPDGLTPKQQLSAIHEEVSTLIQAAQNHRSSKSFLPFRKQVCASWITPT